MHESQYIEKNSLSDIGIFLWDITSLLMRLLVVYDQVRHKPACTATKTSHSRHYWVLKLEIILGTDQTVDLQAHEPVLLIDGT